MPLQKEGPGTPTDLWSHPKISQFPRRIWEKDPALWKQDQEVQKSILNRLGWLTSVSEMEKHAEELTSFAQEIKNSGFTHIVLLGMGGSSMAPEVCRQTFRIAVGFPEFTVLDTTDPATIVALERSLDPAKTLFVVATKSGTTLETLSLYRYFEDKVKQKKGDIAGESFIAITDPGTPLESAARDKRFRRVFLNPPDIGGRYSALSYFGLVPAALMGIRADRLLERARTMQLLCGPNIPSEQNPGIWLGTHLGALGGSGKNKITFVLSPGLASFGYWVEQLIAESTGKEGRGLVPIEGEPPGAPGCYGDDRVFVYMRLQSLPYTDMDRKVDMLEISLHPVIRQVLTDSYDLGAEFFRWELATATAGVFLGINPFDEPNVKESKDNTDRILKQYLAQGKLPDAPALSPADRTQIASFLRKAEKGDYIALLAYIQKTREGDGLLTEIRTALRDALKTATTVGYGPRFLHSTGQLHKGGDESGVFIQLVAEDLQDAQIPGESYTFGVLKQAQALGDLEALKNKGRRVIRISLGSDVRTGLMQLKDTVQSILGAAKEA